MKFSCLISILAFFAAATLHAQEGPQCPDPPPPGGGTSCQMSCVYCNLDGFQSTNNGAFSGGNAVCGAITLHNDFWFGFVAGDDTIAFDFIVSNCQNGDGLQFAIFDDCTDPDALVCNPGCGGCGDMVYELGYTAFSPGQTYWLVVDGWVADVCDFEISVTQGSIAAPAPAAPGVPVGPANLCPGGSAVYTVQDTFGVGYYHWTAPPGASINGGSNNLNINAPEGAQVTVTFGAVSGSVCVQSGNSCHPLTANYCLPVSVADNNLAVQITGADNGCITDSLVLSTLVMAGNPQFLWEGPGGFSSTDQHPHVTALGQYTVTVTSQSGCSGTASAAVNLVGGTPDLSATGDTITCANTMAQLLSHSTYSDLSYAWTGPNGFLSDEANPMASDTGFYHLTVVSQGGCSNTASASVAEAIAIPDVSASGGTITCTQASVQLTGSSTDSNVSFSWTGPNGFHSDEANPMASDTGVYILTIVNQAGCSNTASATVAAIIDIPDVSATGGTITCTQSTAQLSGSSTYADVTFSWTGPNGFQSDEANPVVSEPGQYVLTVTTQDGCSNTASATVAATIDIPDVSATGGTITCTQSTAQLSGSSTYADVTFSWTGPNGFQSDEANPVVSEPGQYVLTVTTQDGCSNTASATVAATIDIPDVSATGGTITCTQSTAQLSGSSTYADVTFSWTGPNGFQSDEANPVVSEPGQYVLTVTTQDGCSATASALLDESTTPPMAEVADDTIVCNTYPQLTCTTDAGNAGFLWSGPGGFMSDLAQPEVSQPGVYTVVVTNPINGCTSSDSATVVSIEHAYLIVTDSIVQPIFGQNNGAIYISVSNQGNQLQYAWYLNGILFGNTQDLTGLAPGTYELVVTDQYGCESMGSFTLQGVSSTQTLAAAAHWLVRPNPSTGRFEICCNGTEHSVQQTKVYNAQGRLVSVQQTTGLERDIALDLTQSPSGVYYVELCGEAGSSWVKVVVQR